MRHGSTPENSLSTFFFHRPTAAATEAFWLRRYAAMDSSHLRSFVSDTPICTAKQEKYC